MLQSGFIIPERRLYRAIIEDALLCIARWIALSNGKLNVKKSKDRQGRLPALAVIHDGREAWRYLKSEMFEEHCDSGGLSASYIRKHLSNINICVLNGSLDCMTMYHKS